MVESIGVLLCTWYVGKCPVSSKIAVCPPDQRFVCARTPARSWCSLGLVFFLYRLLNLLFGRLFDWNSLIWYIEFLILLIDSFGVV